MLIVIAGTGFFMLVSPKYEDIKLLQQEVNAYENALANSKVLDAERDKLVTKYNNINDSDLQRLEKMLPDNIDNIRVILEIERLVRAYGMSLTNIRYEDKQEEAQEGGVIEAGQKNASLNEDYGVWNLEFTTEGSYSNFIALTKDIERNLRLVDIASVDFNASNTAAASKSGTDNYQYTFKIKTYWLKKQ